MWRQINLVWQADIIWIADVLFYTSFLLYIIFFIIYLIKSILLLIFKYIIYSNNNDSINEDVVSTVKNNNIDSTNNDMYFKRLIQLTEFDWTHDIRQNFLAVFPCMMDDG